MNHWKDGGATTPQPIQPECDIKISQNTRQQSIGVAFNVTAVTAGGAATEGARCGNSAQLLKVTAVKWRSRSVLVYSTVFDTLEGIIN